MSDIAPANTFANTLVSTSGTSPNQSIGEEFDSFIRLLTAQVQNQDPLAPLDSTQFVEQLATFSSLEQQVQSNQSLEQISALISDLNSLAANEWLGEEVTIESSYVPYLGESLTFEIDPPASSDTAILTVRDPNGLVILSEALDRNSVRQNWDGRLNGGATALPGTLYNISIDYYQNGTFTSSEAPKFVTTVTETANEAGKLMLGTAMRLTANAEDVRPVEKDAVVKP